MDQIAFNIYKYVKVSINEYKCKFLIFSAKI